MPDYLAAGDAMRDIYRAKYKDLADEPSFKLGFIEGLAYQHRQARIEEILHENNVREVRDRDHLRDRSEDPESADVLEV